MYFLKYLLCSSADQTISAFLLYLFSVKDGVLKEVMGIMVSYRIMVKLIVAGSVAPLWICV